MSVRRRGRDGRRPRSCIMALRRGDMAAEADSVTIDVQVPQDEYQRIAAHARKEHRSVAQVIPALVDSELRRRERARELMEQVSLSYRQRLATEGKLDQTAEEVLEELRALREQIADELYPD